jgi:hypothetical protein
MSKLTSKKALAATVAGLAVAGGGAAIAASQTDSPASSFFDSVAGHLGISPQELAEATKAAAVDEVDQALEDGRITKEQADALKERIASGEAPRFFAPGMFGFRHGGPEGEQRGFGAGPGPGHHLFFGDRLESAAEYLGLTQEELRERLESGLSLGEIAEAEGKSVDGLTEAVLAAVKTRLDEAVAAERLTQDEADRIYERLDSTIADLVEGKLPARPHRGFGPGPRLVPPAGPDDEGGGGMDWDTAA